MEKFLTKYGLFIAAFIAALGILAFFFLKPQNLVPEKCGITGFECGSIELRQEKGELGFALANRLEKGIVLKSVAAANKETGIECREEFDDIWQFATGKHIAAGETAAITVKCAGISSKLVHSGNIRLSVELLWHPDDTSDAGARTATGEIITGVEP